MSKCMHVTCMIVITWIRYSYTYIYLAFSLGNSLHITVALDPSQLLYTGNISASNGDVYYEWILLNGTKSNKQPINETLIKCSFIFFACLFEWDFRPTREIFTHMETALLPWKGYNFLPILGSRGLWTDRVL